MRGKNESSTIKYCAIVVLKPSNPIIWQENERMKESIARTREVDIWFDLFLHTISILDAVCLCHSHRVIWFMIISSFRSNALSLSFSFGIFRLLVSDSPCLSIGCILFSLVGQVLHYKIVHKSLKNAIQILPQYLMCSLDDLNLHATKHTNGITNL